MAVIHEVVLQNNDQRYHIGRVIAVARKEGPEVLDAIGGKLLPTEILFDVGDLIIEARAVPMNVTSEVNVGDTVMVFSFETLYGSTFFYYPMRALQDDHNTIHSTYGNAEIEFQPVDSNNTDLVIASGKSLAVLESSTQKVTLKSGAGGIQANAGSGLIDIKNDQFKLYELVQELIQKITKLTVLTPMGPAKLMPNDVVEFMNLGLNFSMLLGPVEDSAYDPHLPNNTYTVEFAARAVEMAGSGLLDDEGDSEPPSPEIIKLIDALPEDVPPKDVTGAEPEEVPIGPSNDIEELTQMCGLTDNLSPATILTENFTLGDLTTKAYFPHKLKSQKNLTQLQIACNLKALALNILEPIKAKYSNMFITSGFRGAPSMMGKVSQHELGEAVDIQFSGSSSKEVLEFAKWVIDNVVFDQFIFEHGNNIWFHLSFRAGKNRKRVMTMYKKRYELGLKLYYT